MQKESKTDYTLTTGRAGLKALPIVLLFLFFYKSIYYLLWGGEGLKPGFTKFMHYSNFIPIFIGGIIVHELLHLKVPNHGKLFKTLMKVFLA